MELLSQNAESQLIDLFDQCVSGVVDIRDDVLRLTLFGLSKTHIAENLNLTVEEVAAEQGEIFRQSQVEDRIALFRKLLNAALDE